MEQPETARNGGAKIIPFPRPAARLTWRDRMDVAEWREAANRLGYDRLEIHERDHHDPPDLECFLSIYRTGTKWACWSLVRNGPWVVAWCSGTGADAGRFASVADALGALLPRPDDFAARRR
jgi:hypothetical protein